MEAKADNDRHNENINSLIWYFFNDDIFVEVCVNASDYSEDKCPRAGHIAYQVIK